MAKTPEIDLRDSLVGNNLIINGDMNIAQRGTSLAAIGSGTYLLDRWQYAKNGSMIHTMAQDTDVPTFAQAGRLFQNSLRLNLTTAYDSMAAGDYTFIQRPIEGYDFTKIAQKSFTISFWVKASLTGIYHVAVRNSGGDRSCVKQYTINTANTWEKKEITFTGSPSSGTWNYTNGLGLFIRFVLASGSTYHSPNEEYQSAIYLGKANQVNGVATGSTDFRITGVMLNEGIEALPFSLAGGNYANELQLCQRYFERPGFASGTVFPNDGADFIARSYQVGSSASIGVQFKVSKRIEPTMTVRLENTGGTPYTVANASVNYKSTDGFWLNTSPISTFLDLKDYLADAEIY